MKKQWRTTIILVVVLGLMLLAWLGSTLLPGAAAPSDTTSATTVLTNIFKAEAADISSMVVSNESATFSLLPKAGTDTSGKAVINWVVQDMADYPFAAATVNELASVGLKIDAGQEIAAGVTDLGLYGLAAPKTKLTVILKNGEKHTISFGNEIASGSYNYAVLDDSGTIYTVASSTVDKVKYDYLDLLDKSLVVGIEEKNLNSFAFERSKDNLKLVSSCVYAETVSDEATTTYFNFSVLEPIKKIGNTDNLTVLAKEALALEVSSFIELNPTDLVQYGLDKPLYTFTLGTGSKSVVLKIGKKADDSSYYMLSDAVPAVFSASSSAFSLLDMKFTEMVERFVALEGIWQVDQVKVDLPEYDVSFTTNLSISKNQNANDEGVAFTLDGENAAILNQKGDSLYSDFYVRIIAMQFEDLDTQAAPVNTHDGSIVYSIEADLENNIPAHTKMIEFAKRDAYTYYVFIDGIYTGYYIDGNKAFLSEKIDSEGIVIAYRNMKYAIAHAVNGVFNTEEGYQSD